MFYNTINTKAPFYVIKSENRCSYIQEKRPYSNQQDPRIKDTLYVLCVYKRQLRTEYWSPVASTNRNLLHLRLPLPPISFIMPSFKPVNRCKQHKVLFSPTCNTIDRVFCPKICLFKTDGWHFGTEFLATQKTSISENYCHFKL